jgi:pimeloyl-ACP methyl ester carboxylesterase
MALRHVQVVDKDDPSNVMTANVSVPAAPNRRKETIVMLPFWGGYAETYRKVQQDLVDRCPNNASIAISYRGTSMAINKDLDTNHQKYAISATSASISKFLQSDAITNLVGVTQLIICSHSWSAKVSLSFLSREAQRAGITVQSLIFIGPSPARPIILEDEDREYRRHAYDSVENAKLTIVNALSYQKLSEEEISTLAQHMVSMSVAAKKGWIEVGIWEDWATDIEAFAANQPELRVPVHVIVADQDKVEPPARVEKETVDFLRGLGFHVTLEKLDDCGHLIPLERPEAVTTAVEQIIQRS